MKGMATHSSILAWRIPWTEMPGELQSMVLQKSDTTEWLTLINTVLVQFMVLKFNIHLKFVFCFMYFIYSVFPVFFWSLPFSFGSFYSHVFQTHWSLSWSCPVCWWAHQKHSSFQLQGFYFLAFFHRIATFLLTLPICASMLSTFSARTLSISFIVILNFLSDNFRMPAISEFGPEAYFVFQIVFLAFSMPFSFSVESKTWCIG